MIIAFFSEPSLLFKENQSHSCSIVKVSNADFLITVKPDGTATCVTLTALILQRLTVVSQVTFMICLINNAIFFFHFFSLNSMHIGWLRFTFHIVIRVYIIRVKLSVALWKNYCFISLTNQIFQLQD